MNDPPTTGHFAASNRLLAVQQDTAAILVDWQLFHDWEPHDGTFHGAIFIITTDGHQIHSLPWPAATDIAADTALRLAGWDRTDNWIRDNSGRRVARVPSSSPHKPVVLHDKWPNLTTARKWPAWPLRRHRSAVARPARWAIQCPGRATHAGKQLAKSDWARQLGESHVSPRPPLAGAVDEMDHCCWVPIVSPARPDRRGHPDMRVTRANDGRVITFGAADDLAMQLDEQQYDGPHRGAPLGRIPAAALTGCGQLFLAAGRGPAQTHRVYRIAGDFNFG